MSKPKDSNPFAKLAEMREQLPPGPAAATAPKAAPREKPGPARAVVRYERAGRGGKEATVIEKLELPGKDLEIWCKALKQALGCGGNCDEGNIVLQGDQRERLPKILTARGVRKVTVS